MNQTFSWSRFGRLLRTYFVDNRGQLLANLALLAGVLIVLAFVFYLDYPIIVDRNRSLLFFLVGWSAWYAFIWQQTDIFNHKELTISYLLRPAAHLEKFTLLWLITGLGFALVHVGLFTLIDAAGVAYVNSREWTSMHLSDIQQQGNLLKIKPFYASDNFWPPTGVLVLTTLLHPFALAFLLFIRRYGLPLVAVLAIGLLLTGLFGNAIVMRNLFGAADIVQVVPFSRLSARSPSGLEYRMVEIIQPIGNQIMYLVGCTAFVLLYITAYFRLKEREV